MSAYPVKYDPSQLDKLTDLERAFVLHPEVMTKPIKAAVESGYSKSWARGNASRKRKQLMYYILPVAQQRWSKADVSLDRIQAELAAIAFADPTEFYERVDIDEAEEGKPPEFKTVLVGKDPTLLPPMMKAAIESIELNTTVFPSGITLQFPTYVLHDKKAALKMLAEMLGGFDPSTRAPGDIEERRRQAALFEFMKPEELDTITKIYRRAEKRQQAATATDAEIIEHVNTK